MEKLSSNSRTTEVDIAATRIVGAHENTAPRGDLALDGMVTSLGETGAHLTEAINRSKTLSKLDGYDVERDGGLRSLNYLITGYSHHPDPAIRGAAEALAGEFGKYGVTVAHQSYGIESSLINSLLGDLGKPELQPAIAALSGCAELIAALQAANTAFEQAYLLYQEEKASEGAEMNATDLKKEVLAIINDKLTVYLDAMMLTDPAGYGNFVGTVAAIIAENNEAVRRRRNDTGGEEEPEA